MFFSKNSKSYDRRINFDKQLLYIHIPKTGGTSVIKTFGFKFPSHIKANEIYNTKSRVLLKNRFSFSVVRHPILRFISLYNYAQLKVSYHHNNVEPEKSLYGKHLDYEILKEATLDECVHLLFEGLLKHDESWNHWQPQYTWLFDDNDNLLVKKIYKIENLIEFENDFSKSIGKQIRLPLLNKSKKTDEAVQQIKQMSKESLNVLHNYYRKDFELLKY